MAQPNTPTLAWLQIAGVRFKLVGFRHLTFEYRGAGAELWWAGQAWTWTRASVDARSPTEALIGDGRAYVVEDEHDQTP